ncbi:MAG: carbon-nitrogen hydrolase family protein [Nitrospirae bacterium]|nr:carbon-nitrogen hydrolase family protein [Nitrospirota bacterium]
MGKPRESLTVGLVQMDAQDDMVGNVRQCESFILEGRRRGAQIVAFPEHCLYLGKDKSVGLNLQGTELRSLQRAAARARVHVLIGSFREKIRGEKRVYNTSVLINSRGGIAAIYRKIHLFESHFRTGPSVTESDSVKPGKAMVTARIGGVGIGLSICYDLRFPELYRKLTLKGSEILCVPANFNVFTGKDHWFPLLQARAIENQAFVVAPAQIGAKPDGWIAFGHACVIDPWGRVLFDAGKKSGVFPVKLDLAYLATLRRELPALRNIRLI